MRRAVSVLMLAALAAAPAADPSPAAARTGAPLLADGGVRAARTWAAHRAGAVSWAVMDDRGRLRGLGGMRHYESASVAKAMLLVAVCRQARHRPLTAIERGLLRPMVTESDNEAAIAVYPLVGGAGMLDVARAAGMRSFLEAGHWSGEGITAADQARLFFRLDRVLPPRHRAYARHLLASIVARQRWGIAPVARARGMRVLFKGGWREDLTHQVARIERDGRHAAIAVLTEGAPSRAYGQATIAGIARRLLAPAS